MREIHDVEMLERVFSDQQSHFCIRPPFLRLLMFEKGELLTHPLKPLDQFLIVIEGHVIVYNLTHEGNVRYIDRGCSGMLLGDMEFSGAVGGMLYTESVDQVLCLSFPFQENRQALERDPVFLRFVLSQLAGKLSMSSQIDTLERTLSEKLLLYLRKIEPTHTIHSVNETIQILHCSRRQLQRVLKALCDEGLLIKNGRGCYSLATPIDFCDGMDEPMEHVSIVWQ